MLVQDLQSKQPLINRNNLGAKEVGCHFMDSSHSEDPSKVCFNPFKRRGQTPSQRQEKQKLKQEHLYCFTILKQCHNSVS
jgi:hypothetical protein